eukprot:6061771-Pyramimonas_sp.AAC.1
MGGNVLSRIYSLGLMFEKTNYFVRMVRESKVIVGSDKLSIVAVHDAGVLQDGASEYACEVLWR